MQQEFSFEPITKIQKDLSSSPFLRFYLQEETFRTHDEKTYELPFNQVALEIINQIQLSSKFLTANTRINNNFLMNGKDIFNRKKGYFQSFLKQYKLIEQGLVYLPPLVKEMFIYTVIAFSNLILKLSINTNKINIVIITETPTPSFLNVFIVSVLFEKFLGLQVINSKDHKLPEDRKNAIRQLPKLTIIKLCKKRNPFDFYLLSKAQDLQGETHNIQFIEIFQEEETIAEHLSELELKRREKFNVKQLFGLRAPYGMELYFIFHQLLIEKMNSFKPDSILLVDALPGDQLGIQAKVKGLILNDLSAKVQNKISIFKVIGVTDSLSTSFLTQEYRVPRTEFSEDFRHKILMTLDERVPNIYLGMIKSADNCILLQQRRQSVGLYVREKCEIEERITSQFMKLRDNIIQKKLNFLLAPEEQGPFKQMRKQFHEDISNLSLSLTQQSNFEEALQEFRNFQFSVQFLEKVIGWVRKEKQKVEADNWNNSDLKERLDSKIERLERMKEMTIWSQNPERLRQRMFVFYNLVQEKLETPLELINGKEVPLNISQKDEVYIYYSSQHLILFHLNSSYFSIYFKKYSESRYLSLRRDDLRIRSELSAKHSTLIANDKYFYKAFGEISGLLSKKSLICRLRIENLAALNEVQWEIIDVCIQSDRNMRQQVPLQVKVYGWAQSLEINKLNYILFGGGLNINSVNEEKINKCLYIIRDHIDEVIKVGKTNSSLDVMENDRKKCVIHPLIYGVPFGVKNSELVMLSTNGYTQSLNNWKKLFVTKYRLPSNNYQGFTVISQSKLDTKLNSEVVIAGKNSLLSLIMRGYSQVNRFQDKACFFNIEGYPVIISFQPSLFDDKVATKTIAQKEDRQQDLLLSFPNSKMIQRESITK